VAARNLFEQTTFPGGSKSIPVSQPAVRLSESPGNVRHRAPTLGEHTTEILNELGFSPGEITLLREQGVV
jgi:crotonobetainyl-CoA:carnitine CoA-transferase CaiB-like acyl-CoA transferase